MQIRSPYGLLLVLVLLLPSCGEKIPSKEKERARSPKPGPVKEMGEISWYTDPEKALDAAKKEHKILMIAFYGEQHHWCNELDKTTFRDPQVIALAAKFVPLRINGDKDPGARKKFNIRGLPTVRFVTVNGKTVHTVIGYKPAGSFAFEMQSALKKVKD